MCMEDVRIGRETYTTGNQQTVAAGVSTIVVPSNDKRYSLLLVISTVNSGFVRFGPLGNTTGIGIPFGISGLTLLLDIQHHGAMVTDQITVEAVAGIATVNVVTSELNKS